MFQNFQRTIKESIQLEGVGLHNGIKVNLSLHPAEASSGILFKRIDVNNLNNIIFNFKQIYILKNDLYGLGICIKLFFFRKNVNFLIKLFELNELCHIF